MTQFQERRNIQIIDEFIDDRKDREELYALMKQVYVNRKVLELQIYEKIRNSNGTYIPNNEAIRSHERTCADIQSKLEKVSKRKEFSDLEHNIVKKLMEIWKRSKESLEQNNIKVEIGWTQVFENKIREYYEKYFDKYEKNKS